MYSFLILCLFLSLRVECTTWSRDSHGLFDYEARHMNVKHFLVSKASRLFRVGAQVECLQECDPIPYAASAAAAAAASSAAPAAANAGPGAAAAAPGAAAAAPGAAAAASGQAAAAAATQPAEAEEAAAAAGEQQQSDNTPQTTDFLLSIRCSRDGRRV